MKIPAFDLERYFAQHEFTAPYLLCSSDCQSLGLKDLLAMETGSAEKLGDLWLGYTEAPGHPELRREIASLYSGIDATDVLVHAGAQEAIFNFMNVALSPQDHIIVHAPCYQSLFQVAQSIGCEISFWNANADDGWNLDCKELQSLFRKNTKVVVLNSPHNPTGYLMDKEKYAKVIRLTEQHGVTLFMDEVYKGLEYDEAKALPSACEVSPHGVSLGVMSKSFGLAGLRIGWVATQNKKILNEMASFKDYTSLCNSAPSEFLAGVAIRQQKKIIARNRQIIQTNLALLDPFFDEFNNLVEWNRPKAGCIAFPKWKGKGSSDEFCQRVLKGSGVLLAPSSRFSAGDQHFRIGFGRKNFSEGLTRLATTLIG